MHILWIILIGFVAGVIAKLVTPGDNEDQGDEAIFRRNSKLTWRNYLRKVAP